MIIIRQKRLVYTFLTIMSNLSTKKNWIQVDKLYPILLFSELFGKILKDVTKPFGLRDIR
jgi:hypothetical protein